jgi:cytochrome P450
MTDTDVRDEAMAFFLAGHETTALALTWTFYLLSQHPQAQAVLDEELKTVLNGRPPTAANLPRLPYTGMVLRESMRPYPPAYAFARDSLADCKIGGWLVPGASSFATLEATLLLASIAQRFRLALVPDHPIALQPLMTLRPRHGMRMSLHERVRAP